MREVPGLRKDGSEFPAEIVVSEMQFSGTQGYTAVVRDITERKQMDRLKSEFVSTVSHELRTPLTSIRGSLGLLRGGIAGELPPESIEMIDIAYANTDRLTNLINDILDTEALKSGKLDIQSEKIDLAALLQRSLDENAAYGARYGVTYRLASGIPEITLNADPDRILQVLANLLSNAAKFTPAGEEVDVSVTLESGRVRIAVIDRGKGISQEFQNRIFERFAQADSSDKRTAEGTDLGLSISRGIVEAHGGEIGFDSVPDRGTTFYFYLPTQDGEPNLLVLSDAPKRSGKVLVCEDEPDVSLLLSKILEEAGFDREIAPTAFEAKRKLADGKYVAMTLDIRLPDQDGLDLARELRESGRHNDLPVVVVSAVVDEARGRINGDAFGIVDWIQKPIDPQRLDAALRLALPDGRPRVLHIEDDDDLCRVVARLMNGNAEVVAAGTVAESVRRLRNESFDLLLLDLALPDGDGARVVRLMQESGIQAVPIVVFSASEAPAELTREVAAALVKSRTSDQELRNILLSLLPAPEPARK